MLAGCFLRARGGPADGCWQVRRSRWALFNPVSASEEREPLQSVVLSSSIAARASISAIARTRPTAQCSPSSSAAGALPANSVGTVEAAAGTDRPHRDRGSSALSRARSATCPRRASAARVRDHRRPGSMICRRALRRSRPLHAPESPASEDESRPPHRCRNGAAFRHSRREIGHVLPLSCSTRTRMR